MFKDAVSHWISHYNHERYWKWRKVVIDSDNKIPRLIKMMMLIYCKRSEAFQNAYLGTTLGERGLKQLRISPWIKWNCNFMLFKDW